MRTAVTEMFGIEFPILAFTHCRDVAAEVSRAGGLGVLGVVGHTEDDLETDLAWIREQVGNRPFGVDLVVPARYEGVEQGGLDVEQANSLIPNEHRQFLDEMLERYDVPPLPLDDSDPRDWGPAAPLSGRRAGRQLEIALAYEPALVANALGPPPPEMITQGHAAGAKVAALAGRAAHAERHVAAGVDLIVAQGYEAGGHTGEVGSMVLIPEVVDAVAPVPVLGAGGIGRGRQMAAAMALGAQGAWCGSVWLTTEEAETHPAVKQKFLAAGSSDTERSRTITGKPARMLRSAWTEEWNRADTPDPLPMPLQIMLTGEPRRRIDRVAHHPGSGAEKLTNYFVGQIVGAMNQSLPTRQVVYNLVEEFIEAVEGLTAQLDD
ncbi:MAG: nitronate monooxygenase [Acidimicrobiia bacterium]|nr:nitronate monooxygenase [Acidimicrobiia bacterium]MYG72737.1 nitronate monooxygenase [Acidimicrobiia bacterium]